MDEARALRTEAFDLVIALDQPEEAMVAGMAPRAMIGGIGRDETRIAYAPARPRPRWRVPVAWAASLIGAVALGYTIRDGSRPLAAPAAETVLAAADQAPDDQSLGVEPARREATASRLRATDGIGATAAEVSPSTELTPATTRRPAEVASPMAAKPVAPAPSAVTESLPTANGGSAQAAEPPRPLLKAAAPVVALDEKKDADSAAERRSGFRANVRSRDAESGRGGAAASPGLKDKVLRLDRPAPPNPADQRTRIVSAVTAIRALGGSIRLVDGLTPTRFEQIGEVIRVVYRTDYGVVALEQWRAGELLVHELVTPTGTPQDSVAVWERRVR